MNEPATIHTIPSMSRRAVAMVDVLEEEIRKLPQVELETLHTIHGGVYTRTIMIPQGVVITGVLIKIPTTIIVSEDTTVFVGSEARRLRGYHVMPASGHRKQAFYAHRDTWLTMLFGTDARSVEEAEERFTDYAETLGSRHPDAVNNIIITED